MAISYTPEEADALSRVRAEINLFLMRYSRRLKTRAAEIALELISKHPEDDPDAIGRRAVAQAGKELKLLTRSAQASFTAED